MEEHRPRVFERRLMRIFEAKRVEAIEEWRELHNKELHVFYFSPSIIRLTEEDVGTCGTNGE
jgi:hypothetical protein